jgi:hypothetical protein
LKQNQKRSFTILVCFSIVGKSTFVEGLLGFQFNIVDSNIGTRRPLILQMINNQQKEQPSCRFRREDPAPNEDPFESSETPVTQLVEEIVRRTNDKAGKDPTRVSDVPVSFVLFCFAALLSDLTTCSILVGFHKNM